MQAKTQAALMGTLVASSAALVFTFASPAPVQAANSPQPAATQPTPELCAPISEMKPEQVLDLARQRNQQAAFGQLLNPDAVQQCPVTVSYQELRGAIGSAQSNQFLRGFGLGLASGWVGMWLSAALRNRQ